MTDISLIYCPFPDSDSARATALALVTQKLAACCNLLPAGESHYLWQGELTVASEVILLAKTTPEQLQKATALLATLHPHECPAILSFPASANLAFAAWVATSTA